MSVMNIAQCLGKAYPLAFTPANILSAFQATGIWPLNRNVFSDTDFAAASVTDRDFTGPDQTIQLSPNTSVARCDRPTAAEETPVLPASESSDVVTTQPAADHMDLTFPACLPDNQGQKKILCHVIYMLSTFKLFFIA